MHRFYIDVDVDTSRKRFPNSAEAVDPIVSIYLEDIDDGEKLVITTIDVPNPTEGNVKIFSKHSVQFVNESMMFRYLLNVLSPSKFDDVQLYQYSPFTMDYLLARMVKLGIDVSNIYNIEIEDVIEIFKEQEDKKPEPRSDYRLVKLVEETVGYVDDQDPLQPKSEPDIVKLFATFAKKSVETLKKMNLM